MSTGAALLAKLKKNQKTIIIGDTARRKVIDNNNGNNNNQIIISPVCTSNVNKKHNDNDTNKKDQTKQQHDIFITVCTGLNCGTGGVVSSCCIKDKAQPPSCGTGSSATLIEIEELVAEYQHNNKNSKSTKQHKIIVRSGGCTDHCTMGPNVFVEKVMINDSTKHHFTNVNSTSACANVTSYATSNNTATTSPSVTNNNNNNDDNPSNSILWNRVHGLRWKALREISRAQVGNNKDNQMKQAEIMLNDASRAEVDLIRPPDDGNNDDCATQLKERAIRRKERLLCRLKQGATNQ